MTTIWKAEPVKPGRGHPRHSVRLVRENRSWVMPAGQARLLATLLLRAADEADARNSVAPPPAGDEPPDPPAVVVTEDDGESD